MVQWVSKTTAVEVLIENRGMYYVSQHSYSQALYFPEMKSVCWRDIYTLILTVAVFTIARYIINLGNHEEMSKKMWYRDTVEYYSVLKKEILPFVTAWVGLEEIVPGKISQAEGHILHDLTCR